MRATPLDFLRSCGLQALAALGREGPPFHVADERATLRAIRECRSSLARYGDGELEIMIGRGIHFQEYDPELAHRLRIILRAPSPQFVVGLPNFGALQIKTQSRRRSWERYRLMFSHLVERNREYHSAFVSRPGAIADLESAEYYAEFARIWAGREVVLVHHSAAVAQHPLFRVARSVRHVPCAAAAGIPRVFPAS